MKQLYFWLTDELYFCLQRVYAKSERHKISEVHHIVNSYEIRLSTFLT